MRFLPIQSYSLHQLLYIEGCTFAIKTKNGAVYDECELHSSYGHAGRRDYHFVSSGVIITSDNVESIAFEDPTLDPLLEQKKVLSIYELELGWRGCVMCTAYSLEDAKLIMKQERDGLDERDFKAITVHNIEGYTYVNYGDE